MFVDEEDRDEAAVGVWPEAEDAVRRRAWRVVVEPREGDGPVRELVDEVVLLVQLQQPGDCTQDLISYLLCFTCVLMHRIPAKTSLICLSENHP